MRRSNAALFWPVLAVIVVVDFVTKWWASTSLPRHFPQAVVGDALRWTLVYNPGAAFGLNIGSPKFSRWVFMALTIIALAILSRLYTSTKNGEWLRTFSLALVCAGAMGNLIDRIRHADGVVDFIDVGVGMSRWPTFNVADMAVSVGACLLAWVLWDEDRLVGDAPAVHTGSLGGGSVAGGSPSGVMAAVDAGDRG